MEKIWVAIRTNGVLHRFGEIQIKLEEVENRSIAVVPHIPLGFHYTIHDATKNRPHGVIHGRLNPKLGKMITYPGAEQISDARGVAQPERMIPAFKDIKGVLSVFSPAAIVALSAIRDDLERLRTRDVKKATLVALNPSTNAVGWDLLLVESGNLKALEDWLSYVDRLGNGMPDRTQVISTDVFTAFRPWLAVVGVQDEVT